MPLRALTAGMRKNGLCKVVNFPRAPRHCWPTPDEVAGSCSTGIKYTRLTIDSLRKIDVASINRHAKVHNMSNRYSLHHDTERDFKEVRDSRRQDKAKSLEPLWYFAAPTFIIIFLPFLINIAVDDIEQIKHLNFFTFTFGVTFFSVALLWKAKSEGDLALTRIEEKIGDINDKTTETFRELIEPLFEQFDDIHQARELLIRVYKDLQKDDATVREIHYIGAASIYPNDDELFELESEAGENYQIAIRYRRVFDAIVKDKDIQMHRYFSKFDPKMFNEKLRDKELVRRYRTWLLNQKQLVQSSSGNYTLWDAMRAPVWGSTKSTILTNTYIVDIYPSGAGGVSIRGRSLSRQQKVKLVDGFLFGGTNNPVTLQPNDISEHEGSFEK
jgi:hypothetical protein